MIEQQMPTLNTETVPVNGDRLSTALAGTGAVVVMLDAEGKVSWSDPTCAAFFRQYAIPALETLGVTASTECVFDDRIPGVLAKILPAANSRRAAIATLVILAKREGFDAQTEDVQRWCSKLAIDAKWLGSEAAHVASVSAPMLSRLAELGAAALQSETKMTALQRELDSLSGQLSDTYEELTLIYQISGGMRVNRSMDDFFLQACMDVIDVMTVRSAGYAVTDSNGNVEGAALYGEVTLDAPTAQRLNQELLRHFASTPRPILCNRLSEDATFDFLASQATQLVAVPIQRQDRIMGAVYCLDKVNSDFTTQDSKLLSSIANETAIYLENLTLFTDARGLMMGLLHALTSAVDAKDTYTCGHSQRVALFGREIAQRAGLPEALCERVYMAGLLHDVGKIGVPEEVLRKPGKLTDEEFKLMKTHVEIGARILKDVRQIGDLIPGVLYHHERYDGKGYPHNLCGQQIPLIARILCVADCFDAMTSNRTYRKALPIEVALLEIRRCSGTQFDPVLADAFLSLGASRLRELINSVTDQTAIRLAA
jgi:HD-GYP domain-containing protein (c-di-GMP phosphodiesterase class II)